MPDCWFPVVSCPAVPECFPLQGIVFYKYDNACLSYTKILVIPLGLRQYSDTEQIGLYQVSGWTHQWLG